MKFNGEFWEGNTATTAGSFGHSLTLEHIQAAIRSIPKLPPMPKYDVYPSAFVDRAYEINTSIATAFTEDADRRMLVAPPTEAWHWYTKLRELGVDVRWQPRVGGVESEG
jgi:hypothetical protein